MTCQQFQEMVQATPYIESNSTQRDMSIQHLSHCPSCYDWLVERCRGYKPGEFEVQRTAEILDSDKKRRAAENN
jgi:predicted anti-sigma-YlaC factor YlaD